MNKKIIAVILTAAMLICTLSATFSAAAEDDNAGRIEKAFSFCKDSLKPNFSLEDGDANKLSANIFTLYSVATSKLLDNADYDFLAPVSDKSETVDALTKYILAGALTDVSKDDLAAAGKKLNKLQGADGGFANASNVETVTATAFAALALEIADCVYVDDDFNITPRIEVNREKTLSYLNSKLLADNGFNDYDTVANVDTTSMAMMALSAITVNFVDDDVAQNAEELLEKCTEYLVSTQNSKGFFVGKGQWDSANSCSQSYAIMALSTSASDKVTEEMYNNAINALVSLQDDNGGFWYDDASKNGSGWFTEPDYISTYESLMALCTVEYDNLWVIASANMDLSGAPTTKPTTTASNGTTTAKITTTAKTSAVIDNSSNDDSVNTGAQAFNPWIIVILIAAVVVVVLALIPTFRKKK